MAWSEGSDRLMNRSPQHLFKKVVKPFIDYSYTVAYLPQFAAQSEGVKELRLTRAAVRNKVDLAEDPIRPAVCDFDDDPALLPGLHQDQ